MGEVVTLQTETRLDIPADRVIEAAIGNVGGGAVVVGWTDDGDFYFASSIADGGTTLWLLELAKKRLLEIGDA